ncbi:MAG: hypothetical protein O3B42_06155 [Actinomycetota bacterium]|nr:hypothetical protein [Actinomycetota bacterium]
MKKLLLAAIAVGGAAVAMTVRSRRPVRPPSALGGSWEPSHKPPAK